jgi:hypothetical protein
LSAKKKTLRENNSTWRNYSEINEFEQMIVIDFISIFLLIRIILLPMKETGFWYCGQETVIGERL